MFNTKKISILIEIFLYYIILLTVYYNYTLADVTTLSIKPYSQASAADK